MKEIENGIKIRKKIDQYIQGDLSKNEIDQLWVIFLDSPEWFEYFTTLLNLYSIDISDTRNCA